MKKRRFSDKPVSSSNVTISRHSTTKVSINGREYHNRCRGYLRFKLLVHASVLKKKPKLRDCCGNEDISHETSNLFGPNKSALRFNKKDDDRFQDSSNGKNWNNLRVSLLRHVEVIYIYSSCF